MYILIDIGGTKTRVAVSKSNSSFDEPVVFKTPQNFSTWLSTLHHAMSSTIEKGGVNGVVAGVPGTFNKTTGVIKKTPNLPSWANEPLKHHLEKLFSCPTVLENDTALVGLGEATFGAGKGYEIVAYLTISTGVNGVRIVDGKIDRNIFGFEIGHSIIDLEELPVLLEKDVESMISGGALERRFGKPSHDVHDIALWEKINQYAGIFGANTTMYWSPSVIVYGGPVMNDLHIETIEKEAKLLLHMYDETPVFKRGTLKDFGGLYGALALTKNIF